jgi:hypothetical protein
LVCLNDVSGTIRIRCGTIEYEERLLYFTMHSHHDLRRTSCRVDVYLVRPRVNRLASAGPSYHLMSTNLSCDTSRSFQVFHSSSLIPMPTSCRSFHYHQSWRSSCSHQKRCRSSYPAHHCGKCSHWGWSSSKSHLCISQSRETLRFGVELTCWSSGRSLSCWHCHRSREHSSGCPITC